MLARIPDQLVLETVPSRLEKVFKKIDDRGNDLLCRKNGIYELLDAPLDVVRDKVEAFIESEYQGEVTPEDVAFLQKLGIDAENFYILDPSVTSRWGDRWTLTGHLPNSTPKDVNIEVIIPKNDHLSDKYMERAKAFLKEIFAKCVAAAGLGEGEYPTKLEAVPAEHINNFAVRRKMNSDFQALVHSCKEMAEAISTGDYEMMYRAIANVKGLTDTCLRETDPGDAIIFPVHILPVLDAVFQIVDELGENQSGVEIALRRAASPIAFFIAHELAHVIELADGGQDYEEKIAGIINNFSFPKEVPSKLSEAMNGSMLCGLMTAHEMLEDILANRGVIPSSTHRSIQSLFHRKEFDAHVVGTYIAARAGYDHASFGVMYLKSVGTSLTHPAEAKSMKFISRMAGHLYLMGM